MIEPSSYAHKNVVVLGLGRSGKSVAYALQNGGANVLAWDDVEGARNSAQESGVSIQDPLSLDWATIDALILSPGIPHLYPAPHPVVVMARNHGIVPISDIELLFQSESQASFVGVTGTNGKSTTTALIHHILKSSGREAEIGGNFGVPVLDLKPLNRDGVYVLEMSSYQLEITPSQHFQVAVFLNLTPDHLERHGGIKGYLTAKKKIYENSTAHDVLVLGVDDAYTEELYREFLNETGCTVIPISVHKSLVSGIYVEDGQLIDNTKSAKRVVFNLKELPTLKGSHNWQNAACAYAATQSLGVAEEDILEGLQSFPGLVHRQERIAEVDGIAFINDSKATNAEAAAKALDCYQDATIYWLLGGRAKDGGIESLIPYFPKIEHAFLFGEAAPSFALTLEGQVTLTQCGDLSTAFEKAFQTAKEANKKESIVLLSPACASFDQFRDFEARGDAFRALVQGLVAGGNIKVA